MWTLLILYVCAGLLLACISIPLILRRIKPNLIYGFRVEQTLDDPAVWYDVNEYSGWRLLLAGIAAALTALILYRIPGIAVDTYALACLGIVGSVLAFGFVQSWLYMLKRKDQKESGK